MINNVLVFAAEKEQSSKIKSLSGLDLGGDSQDICESDESSIQLYGSAPALTQFKLLVIKTGRAGRENIQNSSF